MPSYITAFQSSPVRICRRKETEQTHRLNLPPNNCMPSRAKMMRKRKSRSRREQIAFMELSSELTSRLRSSRRLFTPKLSYRVILNILSSRMQRSTEMPMGGMNCSSTSSVSRMPPHTTKQSKRLNSAMK
ncbi:hypothetical protein EYF80_016415 [Liparis tanakae]|uniref:Uncharacterized protein n=1 Tax=Liparis tanakae TaxID=230148 RepID=A0A4Z2I7J8_9TELE|nr:hypothetical protein EYF80_016415 [Liparis tanakae]